MKKNYLKLMKIVGAMNSKEEVLMYLCNPINDYQVSKTSYKNLINFYPRDNYREPLTIFFEKGKVKTVFQSFRDSSDKYRLLQFYPMNKYTNKLSLY